MAPLGERIHDPFCGFIAYSGYIWGLKYSQVNAPLQLTYPDSRFPFLGSLMPSHARVFFQTLWAAMTRATQLLIVRQISMIFSRNVGPFSSALFRCPNASLATLASSRLDSHSGQPGMNSSVARIWRKLPTIATAAMSLAEAKLLSLYPSPSLVVFPSNWRKLPTTAFTHLVHG